MKSEKIDKYELIVNPNTREVEAYAVQGKKKILMPSCYQEMYDDQHLAIAKRILERPEVLDAPEGEHYIPLFTGVKQ